MLDKICLYLTYILTKNDHKKSIVSKFLKKNKKIKRYQVDRYSLYWNAI